MSEQEETLVVIVLGAQIDLNYSQLLQKTVRLNRLSMFKVIISNGFCHYNCQGIEIHP